MYASRRRRSLAEHFSDTRIRMLRITRTRVRLKAHRPNDAGRTPPRTMRALAMRPTAMRRKATG
jgi:hypothetical protein